MRSELRERAVKLRIEKNLSYSAIKQELGVPKSTLSYWLRDYPLSKERIAELRLAGWSKGEASRERHRNTMREKKLARKAQIYETQWEQFSEISRESLLVAGLMLYLGEGDKANDSRIALINTDSKVINFFIKWLKEFMGVDKSAVRVQLHLYENMDIEKERGYWEETLKLPVSQYYRPSIRKMKKGSFTYKGSFRHGTCGLFVMGTERKLRLMAMIQAFVDRYLADDNRACSSPV